jgi:hypothetical protein
MIDYGLFNPRTSGIGNRLLVRGSALLGGYSQGETINETVQSAFKGGTSYGPKGRKDWSPIEEKFFSYAEFVLKLQISVFCERLPIYLQKH